MIYICIAIIIALLSVLICVVKYNQVKKQINEYNKEVELKNEELLQKTDEVYGTYQETVDKYEAYKVQYDDLNKDLTILIGLLNQRQAEYEALKVEEDKTKIRIEGLNEQEKVIKDKIAETRLQAEQGLAAEKNLAAAAFEHYCDSLDDDYTKKENEYNNLKSLLEKSYDDERDNLKAELDKVTEELDKIRSTRAAAIEALRREKEILADSSFYCIDVSDEDKADITRLESIKKTLNKPRVLSMLVWSTYYQKPLKQLAANVLGNKTVTGIYKITNIVTGEVYVGQAVNIASRWSEHAKCGLGIDTPSGNKLYKAMQEYGLYSFSWELMEECPPAELNEKERFYIDLYQSVDYGYNILKGNN